MEQRCRSRAGVGGGPLDERLAAHEGLVRLVVRRQQRGALSFADALHEGRLGLWLSRHEGALRMQPPVDGEVQAGAADLPGLPAPPDLGASALPAGTYDGVSVFVTGAGTGLGKAIALEFARLGASIVIARVIRIAGSGSSSSPGSGLATSASVAPQRRCQGRTTSQ